MLTYHKTTEEEKEVITAWQYAGQYAIYNTTPYAEQKKQGVGFADTIDDFEHKTLDECRKLGVNDSMIHEDFMIGTEDLSIDATCEDGRTVPIFRNGTWAF